MSAIRQFAGLRSALRAVALARPAPRLRVASPIANAARAFSVSAISRVRALVSDATLAAKLEEELKYEKEENRANETPEFLKAFKEQGVWTITDAPSSDEVTLTRKFGNETIKLVFSISDVDQANEDEFPQEDEEGDVSEDRPYSYPIRTAITITKPTSKGALVIDAMAQDGSFLADSIAYYADAAVANGQGADADWARRGMYFGPQFEQLDVSVQEEFERFLSERGIDESLALFIPDFAEYKEQQEYVLWLKGVQQFVEA
ncbi:mitochondrial glycoprotein [Auriculariales sp. MPI-PUGE-AT-0066]|nr:mitochondrial glycoprotein [Auriculariales sp. MPI-PUGE-AT-0066]